MSRRCPHRQSRIRTLLAGAPTCRCGAWVEDCPALTEQPAPDWDGPTVALPVVLVSDAPVLTRGQAERVCRDMD